MISHITRISASGSKNICPPTPAAAQQWLIYPDPVSYTHLDVYKRQVELNLAPVMMKRLTITGSTLRARPVAHKAPITRALREIVWPLLASGAIRPLIDRVFPLTEAAAAHALMESNSHIGKILLQAN